MNSSGTFNLPNGSTRLFLNTIPVKGNGKTIGMTDGNSKYGVGSITSQYENQSLGISEYTYGTNVGTSQTSGTVLGKTLGLTQESSYSGIVCDLDSLTNLNYIIKY